MAKVMEEWILINCTFNFLSLIIPLITYKVYKGCMVLPVLPTMVFLMQTKFKNH
jgi:hypothetical protein